MHIMAADEDKKALNDLMTAIREAVPFATVHGFLNPIEALECMKKRKYEVVFLEIHMCKMSGMVLANKLKEIYPKVNLIFVTKDSQYAYDAFQLHASGYVDKPIMPEQIVMEMEHLRYPLKWRESDILVNTFGDFELIVNNKKISFGRKKSKEMLAYLVDQRGKNVTRKELAEILLEREDYSRSTQNYLSKIIKELFLVLKRVGAEKMIQRGYNSYAVNKDAFSCDLYDYENENATLAERSRFQGEYMKQYSWAEVTLAKLYWEKEKIKSDKEKRGE